MKFITRGIMMTSGVQASIERNTLLHTDILHIVRKHFKNEGEECKSDNKLNEEAIREQSGRVLSVFNVKGKKLYVITDGLHLANDPHYGAQYPVTTVLFPDEY